MSSDISRAAAAQSAWDRHIAQALALQDARNRHPAFRARTRQPQPPPWPKLTLVPSPEQARA